MRVLVLGRRIRRSIARKLIDVHALVARIQARDEIRCEATSTPLEPKNKKVYKLEKPQINNEDTEKILIQLLGADTEIGYLSKCLIVVLIFFGLALMARNW